MLPPYCKQLQEEYGIHIGQVAKLIPTLADKKSYVLLCTAFEKLAAVFEAGFEAQNSS